MKIAMVGTRGVPAAYGGFETAVEEIGARLTQRGHHVIVYCRGGDPSLETYKGMRLVHLPAMQRRSTETLSHTALSVVHLAREGADAAFVFNVANAPLMFALRARGIPYAINVDGIEWRRSKWGRRARAVFKFSEKIAVRTKAPLISDAEGIADYYQQEYGRRTEVIAYGAPELQDLPDKHLGDYGLKSREYFLVVARFEPENNIHMIVDGYAQSSPSLPLVIVGDAPYADGYKRTLQESARGHDVRFVGRVDDQDVLNELYFHSAAYLHGHSVGGTNPSLLRALGTGAPTIIHRNQYNLEVAGTATAAFGSASELASLLNSVAENGRSEEVRAAIRARVTEKYDWDDIADAYEQLAGTMVGNRQELH